MDHKKPILRGCLCLLAFILSFLPVTLGRGLPTVDPGLFVISGVGTCGNGEGYCLLGLDCTLDQDFEPDNENGHCDGLKSAFTPSANFVCCKDSNRTDNTAIIDLNKNPELKPIPISMLPNENENEIENVLSKVVQSINSSLSDNEVSNKTKSSQPSKQVNNYEEEHTKDDAADKDDHGKKEENIMEDNDDKREVTEKSSDEEQITTTESSISSEIEEMTEKNDNEIELNNNKFDEVSLKSDEVDESKEGPSKGDDEWLAAPTIEHQMDYKENKKTENKIEPNANNEVNAMMEDEHIENVKSGTIMVQQQEKEEGQNGEVNNKPNNEVVTDNVKNTEAGILNTELTVNNQFDMSNPATNSSTAKPETVNIGNNTHDIVPQRPDKSQDTDTIHTSNTEESKDPEKEENPTEKPCGLSARCIGLVRFVFDKNPLCYGNPLHDDWIVTSASCALRIFRMGMFNVSVVPEEDNSWSHGARIRTIIVHENYRNMENELHLEVNNIGLIRIYPGLGWELCHACLPQSNQQFEGVRCATHPIGMPPQPGRLRFNDHIRVGMLCEGNTELLQGAGNFLSLPCKQSAWIPRAVPNSTPSIGLPLRCDGILAGVQAAEGVGTRVYTPISSYLDWIQTNTRTSTAPMQTFRRLEQ